MKSKMLITDKLVEALHAVVEENGKIDRRSQRAQTIAKWLLGHACDVVQDNNPEWVTVTVGGRAFRDRRAEYPSEKLIADLCLAIYAGEGLSPSAFDIRDLDDMTVIEVLDRGARGIFAKSYRHGKVIAP